MIRDLSASSEPFRLGYEPQCLVTDCTHPAEFKIAAAWSDGNFRELKNYGTACAAHVDQALARARRVHDTLQLTETELDGPVQVYRLDRQRRDTELQPLADPA